MDSMVVGQIDTAIETLLNTGVAPVDGAESLELLDVLERQQRRLEMLQVELFGQIDTRRLFDHVGLFSAKRMVASHTKVSGAEISGRRDMSRMFGEMLQIRAAGRQGLIPVCNLRRLARVYGNVRVRDQFVDAETDMVRSAATMEAADFAIWLNDWVRYADEDGAAQANERRHKNRDAKLIGSDDLGWDLTAWCASMQGTKMRAVFDAYIRLEFLADWDTATKEFGEGNFTLDQLARTDNQRRMDALAAIFERAATLPAGEGDGVQVVLNLVMDQETFERHLAKLAGAETEADAPTREGRRCHTLDGEPVDPTEALLEGLLGHIRRVVIGSDGVTIDLGRKHRLFNNSAALAIRLAQTRCYWPGCRTPISRCHIDHLNPWAQGGHTDQTNGGGLCGKHNRHKETGYRTWRNPDGTFTIEHPNGHLIQ